MIYFKYRTSIANSQLASTNQPVTGVLVMWIDYPLIETILKAVVLTAACSFVYGKTPLLKYNTLFSVLRY